MPKKPSKRTLIWIGAAALVAVGLFIGVKVWIKQKTKLPEGIVSGNGRIEGKLVDVSAKEPLRVKEILVDEGALVKPGEVLVKLDTVTLDAELAEANAQVQAAAGAAGGGRGLDHQAEERDRSRQHRGQALPEPGQGRGRARSGSWTCARPSWTPPGPPWRSRRRCC